MNGREIIPVEYKQINVKGIHIQAVAFDETITYFDAKGNKIEQNKYESILKTDNDNYFVTIDEEGKYGITDAQEQPILENTYRYLEYLYEDYFIAANEEGFLGVINNLGNIVVDFKYEVLQQVDNTYVIEAKILSQNKTELYSRKLELIDTKQNISISSYENYIEVHSQDEVKYFDINGNPLTNEQVCQGPLFAKEENGKWGFIDRDGNIVVDFIYDRTTSSNEYGFAGIKKDGKWGVVDQNGNIITEPTYQIDDGSKDPEFIGVYYKIYYGYGESYYTKEIKD